VWAIHPRLNSVEIRPCSFCKIGNIGEIELGATFLTITRFFVADILMTYAVVASEAVLPAAAA
jgi:hypothetical protein